MGLLEKTQRLPPFVVRLFARKGKGWKPLSHAEIASASGLGRSTVAKISCLKSWDGISIGVADRFAGACGVDLTKPGFHLKWLRRSKLAHLKLASPQQRKLFQKLLATR